MSNTSLLERIEAFLALSGVSPTRFGRSVVHDPRFVFDLRAGRKPRRKMRARVSTYLSSVDRKDPLAAPEVAHTACQRPPSANQVASTLRT